MLIKLIQLLFLFTACTVSQAMNNTATNQRKNVQQILRNNQLSEWESQYTITPRQTPLFTTKSKSTISLQQTTTVANWLKYKKNSSDSPSTDATIEKSIALLNGKPYDFSVLPENSKNASEFTREFIKNEAYNNNKQAIQFLDNYYPKQFFNPIATKDSHSLSWIIDTRMQLDIAQEYAIEWLKHTLKLVKNDVLQPLSNSLNTDIITIRENNRKNIIAPITQSILCLRATNEYEKHNRYSLFQTLQCDENRIIMQQCQFLINGDNNATYQYIDHLNSHKNIIDILTQTAQSPLCHNIIEQLEKTNFNENEPHWLNLQFILAELHYRKHNFNKANEYYSKITPSYLKEKAENSNVCAINAFTARIANTKTFSASDVHYLTSLTADIVTTMQKLEKNNTHISHGVGLLTSTLIQDKYNFNNQQKIDLILNSLDHLEAKTTLYSALCTSLSTLYALENKGDLSIKYMQCALENNNPFNNALLTILTDNNNYQSCKNHTVWLSKILNLIYNPYTQWYDECDKHYPALQSFAKTDLCQQLLPYLGQSYIKHKKNKNEIAGILALLHQNNDDYHKACIYIDFMTHITEPFIHNFITTLTSQKNMLTIAQLIAQKSACSKIINALQSINTTDNTFYRCLAALYYYSNNNQQANIYYSKIKKRSLLSPIEKSNAFNAYLASTETFDTKQIKNLLTLFPQSINLLQAIKPINPKMSYKIGIISHYLSHNSTNFNADEKENLILHGLDHLEYAHINKSVSDDVLYKAISAELHSTLSNIYYDKKNDYASLVHMQHAVKYQASNHKNTTAKEIATILTQAEKNEPDLYKQHSSLINNAVRFINKQSYTIQPDHLDLFSSLDSHYLCSELLPYCEQTYKTNAHNSNEITCLIALAHYNNKNFETACTYIDKLALPLSQQALYIKSFIYNAANKTLSEEELTTVCKRFITKQHPSLAEQKLIAALIKPSNELFVRTKDYKLAWKLITQLSSCQNTLPAALQLAIKISDQLATNNNEDDIKKWNNISVISQLSIQKPTHYDANTNFLISKFLTIKKQPQYASTAIEHLTHALESNTLSIQKTYVAQFTIAVTLLNAVANTQSEIDHAVELLKNNIEFLTKNNALVNADPELQKILDTSIKAIVCAYFNYSSNAARIPILQQLIPLNIPKAIKYLEMDTTQTQLIILRNLCEGNSMLTEPSNTTKELINFERALKITNQLIDQYGSTIDELAQRAYIYAELKDFKKAIADIDYILNHPDFDNQKPTGRSGMLDRKLECLLNLPAEDRDYQQTLACLKELSEILLNQDNRLISLNSSPSLKNYIFDIIDNNITTNDAIELCCFATELQIHAYRESSAAIAALPEEKKLILYLMSTAKKGNHTARFIAMPYLNYTIDLLDNKVSYLFEALAYTHDTLLNHNNLDDKKINALITYLQNFADQGFIHAYFILCDYYKNNPEKFENTMIRFSKVPEHRYCKTDSTNIIKPIFSSCHNTLLSYFDNPQNPLCGALAKYTFGALSFYHTDSAVFDAGLLYLKEVMNEFDKNFQLPRLTQFSQHLCANIYHTQAMRATTNEAKVALLRESAHYGCLTSIHKIAKMWITEKQEGTNELHINENDFVPLLTDDIKNNNPSNPTSLALYEQYIKLSNNSANDNKSHQNRPAIQKIDTAIDQKMNILKDCAIKYGIISNKNINKQETSELFLQALKNKNNPLEFVKLLQQTIEKERHAGACLVNAIAHIESAKPHYEFSEEFVKKTFAYGLIAKKQFESLASLHSLLCYIQTLLNNKHPQQTQSYLLAIIKKQLQFHGIDVKKFCTLFEKVTGLELYTLPVWNNSEIQKPQTVTPIISLFKDTIYKETCQAFIFAVQAFKQGKDSIALGLMKTAIEKHNHPLAYMHMSTNYLIGYNNTVQQDYNIAEKYCKLGLDYGLQDNQLCNEAFFKDLCCYMSLVIQEVTLRDVKPRMLSIIKNKLLSHNIDMKLFLACFKGTTQIDLSLDDDWNNTGLVIKFFG